MKNDAAPNRPRLLVVDDEQVIRELLRRHLTSLGYAVVTAESGEEALSEAPRFRPALVFLDIKMPGMGGLECLKQLRRLFPDIQVVMLTAVLERESVVNAVDIGAQEYLFKPVDLATVTQVLKRLLPTP